MDLFSDYAPLLRQVGVLDSLGVIRAYEQHLMFGVPLPPGIELHSSFTVGHSLSDDLHPWDLEILAREVIINSIETESDAPKTLRSWNYLPERSTS